MNTSGLSAADYANLPRVRSLWVFLGVFALLLVYAIWPVRHWLFGPGVLEASDFGANALEILRAKHFHDLYGNYSRWGFHHPGPVFFYFYAWGEMLFYDLLHWVRSPHQAHVLTGILIQSAFIGASITLFTELIANRISAMVWIVLAAVLFPLFENVITSIWPPHVLFGPFLLLLVSTAGLSLGRLRWLPVAVLATSFLCEDHVAMPGIALPILFVSIVAAFTGQSRRIRSFKRIVVEQRWGIAVSGLIAVVFVIPILIDLAQCPACNMSDIIRYLHTDHGPMPTWGQAVNFIAGFSVFDHHTLWLNNVPGISILTLRVMLVLMALAIGAVVIGFCDKPEFKISSNLTSFLLRWISTPTGRLYLISLLAAAVSTLWAKHMAGGLYDFEAYYVYAIYYTMASAVGVALFRLAGNQSGVVGVALLGAAGIAFGYRHPTSVFSVNMYYRAADATVKQLLVPTRRRALISVPPGDFWEQATSIAVLNARAGHGFWVAPEWGFMFGRMHELPEGYLVSQAQDVEIISPDLMDKPSYSVRSIDAADYCAAGSGMPIPTGRIVSFNTLRWNCAIAVYGFEQPRQSDWAWTTQKWAAIQFGAHRTASDVTLTLQLAPFLGSGHLTTQSVTVWVNGMSGGHWQLSSMTTLKINVPPTVWNRSDIVTVALKLPDAASPATVEGNPKGDARTLAVQVFGVGVQYHQ